MTIFILVLVLTIDPGFYPGYRPNMEVVASPEAAAVRVWQLRQEHLTVNPTLYEVSTKSGTVKEVPVPMIHFDFPDISGTLIRPLTR